MLYIFVKIKVMIDKKTASRLYAMNQMGVRNGDPKPKRGKGNKDKGDAVQVCSKDNPAGCGAYAGGGQSTNAQNKGGAPGLSKKPLYSDRVMSKKQAEKQGKKLAKIRQDAADRSKANSERRKF